MGEKSFTLGFTLAASLGAGFAATFAGANKKLSELTKKLGELAKVQDRLNSAKSRGIIDKDTFSKSSRMLNGQKSKSEFDTAKIISRENLAEMGILYAKLQALGAVFTVPIQKAIQFESAMADVKKVVDFDTPQQFKEMGNDILNLSKRIPMAAEGLAKIVAAGGQSGIAREDLISFAESAAKMGVAFDITADEAGNMMAKWRTAFKMGQSDVIALADKINYLGNTTAASAPLISDVVTRIGPLGAVGGVASGEIAALGASMVGSGIESDVAATGIKNLILAMVAGKSATKSQAEAFASLGMNTTDLAKRMQVDAKGAILDVLKSVKALDASEQASTLQQLFGTESLGAIAPLLSNLDALEDNMNKVGDSTQYAGSMEAEFAARADTTENSVQLMNNRLDAAKIAIGDGLLPILTPAVEVMGNLATAVGDLAAAHPTLIKWLSIGAVAFLGVISAAKIWNLLLTEVRLGMLFTNAVFHALTSTSVGYTIATKIAAGTVRLWTAAQWLLNAAMSANPIGLFILGITALIAIGTVLYYNWDTVKSFFETLWDGAIEAVGGFADSVQSTLSAAYDWVMEKWSALSDFLSHPIDSTIRIFRQESGEKVASNAAGGIYGKGAFLTTFAEDGPEAAIPLDGSRRAMGLWTEAGQRLGAFPDHVPMGRQAGASISIEFRPQVTIQGNADAGTVEHAMTLTVQQLKRMLADIQHEEGRLSYV